MVNSENSEKVIVVGEGGRFADIDPKDPDIVEGEVKELPDIQPYGSHIKPGKEEMLPRVKIKSVEPSIPLLTEKVDK